MAEHKKRQVFESGHHRKFLVIVDDSPEFEAALFFAARVASRTGGRLTMLQIPQTGRLLSWMNIKESDPTDLEDRAQAKFQKFRNWLKKMGFEDLETETIIRSGDPAEEVEKLIERDEDIAILVLGASADPGGPGPIIKSILKGSHAGTFPIPIYLVPETLSQEEIAALA